MYVVVPRPQDDNGAARNLTFLDFPLRYQSIEIFAVLLSLCIVK